MNGLPNIELYEPLNNEVSKKNNLAVDESVRKVFLRGNPFLYNNSHKYLKIDSIEDYYVNYKGNEVTFGEVIHSSEISRFRKIFFIKKCLKKWKKDYILQKK